MLPPGTNPLQDATGASGGVLIPTRFVWPYGGRRVLLTGSFTRWTDHILMSPVEGCPSVFQTIWNLTPGVHQYKFYVDGEWRHDERQPYVVGNYGIVNMLLLAWELDPRPAVLSPEAPSSRMNMDVDYETFQRAAMSSGGALEETTLRISESDIEVSRHRISSFLSAHNAYQLLPESGKGIPVAPLWNSYRGQFVGVLSASDFILILKELGNHGSNLTEEELETHTISAWKEAKQQLSRQMDPCGRIFQRQLIHAGPYDSLKDVALKILQNEVSTIPIIHSSSLDGSFPQLLHIASLSGILKCICGYFRHCSSSLPILQQPIRTIPFGTWVPKIGESNGRLLAMLRPDATLGAALSLLVQAGVSSIPIVDDNDSLLDTYSRSDITALAKDRGYAKIHLDEIKIHEALQLGPDASAPYGFFNGRRCQMCLHSDTLQKVMERLANPGVRRVIIVEAGSKRVEGIISLSDVFRFLLGSPRA
ncbi:sucrose nonfermenting 4-like protein [Cocos nucifera]|uniref:Sucrose nonfermenting 4-like protein n=1 Tax=Cocos nucifera TaxID=13894 RepID=A0A8K0N021_COCNU|nr:sucrose nonfermenting 4-like protein [Cocos nucifera]